MAPSVKVLLMAALVSNVGQAEVIKRAGSSYKFILDNRADFCSISRRVGEGEKLLWNSSEPRNSSSHRIFPLDVSDSGLYRAMCWSQGGVTLERNSSLLVCGKPRKRYLTFYLELGQTEELACGSIGPNQSFQWAYEYMNDETKNVEFTFIDAETFLVHEVQPVKSESSLLVTAKRPFSFFSFFCLAMSHQRCDVVRQFYVGVRPDYIHRSVGESLELNCSDVHRNQPHVWKVPTSVVDDEVSHTLVLPSLTLNHTGYYTCEHGTADQDVHFLYVCPESDPPAVAFVAVGEELTLQCGDWKQAVGIDWLMKTKRNAGRVSLLNPNQPGKMYASNHSLLITNVSVEDSGEFWCVVREDGRCSYTSKTLVMFREPEVDLHLVRSVLLSVAIPVMLVIAVVVEVVWRTRSRETLPVPAEEVEMSDLSPASAGLPLETPV